MKESGLASPAAKLVSACSGIGLHRQGGPAQCLPGADVLLTVQAPLFIDGALRLRLATAREWMRPPALLDAPIGGSPRLGSDTPLPGEPWAADRPGQNGLGFTQGRGDAGDPLQSGIGELLEGLGTVEGPVGSQGCRAVGRCAIGAIWSADDLPEVGRITAVPPEGLHQHGNAGLVFDHEVEHDVGEVRPMIPTGAAGEVPNLLLRAPRRC